MARCCGAAVLRCGVRWRESVGRLDWRYKPQVGVDNALRIHFFMSTWHYPLRFALYRHKSPSRSTLS